MLSFGDFINWVEPNGNYGMNYCVQCGRKVGKNAYQVHVSTSGSLLHPNSDADGGIVSQGFWHVGRECAKQFDPAVLVKN